jgi:hypothetical protein
MVNLDDIAKLLGRDSVRGGAVKIADKAEVDRLVKEETKKETEKAEIEETVEEAEEETEQKTCGNLVKGDSVVNEIKEEALKEKNVYADPLSEDYKRIKNNLIGKRVLN